MGVKGLDEQLRARAEKEIRAEVDRVAAAVEALTLHQNHNVAGTGTLGRLRTFWEAYGFLTGHTQENESGRRLVEALVDHRHDQLAEELLHALDLVARVRVGAD